MGGGNKPVNGYDKEKNHPSIFKKGNPMKNPVFITLGVLIFIICAAAAGYIMVIQVANNSVTHLNVSVAGNVDEVSFFKQADLNHAVAVIHPKGEPTTQTIDLPNTDQKTLIWQASPVKYIYVARSGEAIYRSRVICCATDIRSQTRRLIIKALDQYEDYDN
jgi:hypothetical protein